MEQQAFVRETDVIHSYFEELFLGYFDVSTGAHEATEPNFSRFQ